MIVPPPHAVVLVVDDEPLLRLNATEALQEAGCRTFEACGAAEALSMIADHPEISVLFTDINMPGAEDGLALAGRIRAERPDVQVILTSGQERPQPADIPQNGRFVPKPYDMDVIAALVRAGRPDRDS